MAKRKGKLGKKHKGIPPALESHQVIYGFFHKPISLLNEEETREIEDIGAQREEEEEKERLSPLEIRVVAEYRDKAIKLSQTDMTEYEEKVKSYVEVCVATRLTRLQRKFYKLWGGERPQKEIAGLLKMSTGDISTLKKRIEKKLKKLIVAKYPDAEKVIPYILAKSKVDHPEKKSGRTLWW